MRKPRTTGRDMEIDGLSHINNHPYRFDTPAERKIWGRVQKGLCPACGKSPCMCKGSE